MKPSLSKLNNSSADQQDLYTFTKRSVITLADMIQEQGGGKLNPKFISTHKSELMTPHFCFDVECNKQKWTIIKRLNDFLKLQQELLKFKARLPSIPIRTQSDIHPNNQFQILNFLQIFLKSTADNAQVVSCKQFLKFMGRIVPPSRKKMRNFIQLEMSKRAGGRHNESTMKRALCYFTNWTKKLFTITSQGVYYTASDEDLKIQEVIPFSFGFTLQYGEAQTGYTYGIILNSSHRVLIIDAGNVFNMTYFVYWLFKAMKQNDYLTKKRYKSFANQRNKCHAEAFVDGKDYFTAVYNALLSAKNQVFITGWMLSVYFCLKRPDPDQETRLDRVLKRIAESGIRVNIIVFMEPKVALNLDSQFTQTYLESLSSNIKVLRHPAYLLIPFLWSHHEKMVIVDQKIGFMGGLDIGYGRYDDNTHRLHDENAETWHGVDYCNYRITDIINPKEHEVETINRMKSPRMPWHDVAVKIIGGSVLDLSRHFVQYWNYVNFQLNMNDRELLVYAGLQEDKHTSEHHKVGSKDKQASKVNPSKVHPSKVHPSKVHPSKVQDSQIVAQGHGKEEDNFSMILKSLNCEEHKERQESAEQEIEFYTTHMKGEGSSSEKLREFVKKLKVPYTHKSHRNGCNFEDLVVTEQKQETTACTQGKQNHQLLRSASMWGLGLSQGQEQRSILTAYVELIYNSEQYIYIENQFFISIENTVSKALIERISRAHELKQKFKLMVVIPALPGFEGEIEKQQSAVMRIQLHHIYQTICQGDKSLLQSLHHISNLHDYIQFFTLRTHGKVNGTPVTEIVYVHSKMMVVDDRFALIGSANINDRSLLGSRDSEIAVLIEDQETKQITLKNEKKQRQRTVRKFAHDLRVKLYMEHFDISLEEAEDYHNEDVWWQIRGRAEKNQQIYVKMFGIYPQNCIKTFNDIEKVREAADASHYDLMSTLIKGKAVPFQYNFLVNEDLEIKASQKEYFVPAISFT